MAKPQLLPDVAKAYNLVIVTPGTYIVPGFGKVDLCAITIEQADKLASAGFPYLKAKKTHSPVKNEAPGADVVNVAEGQNINNAPNP